MDDRTPRLDRDFVQRLRELFAERDVECPRCGYCLRGVPGPRCPECGRVVEELLREADVTPWRTPTYQRRALRRCLVRVCALGVLTLVVVAGAIALGLMF